ncbi:MAG: DUF3127 domain-containing protein [Bacteroidales bacterium]
MSLEITGRVDQILQEVTGEGRNGTWKKQEFVLETEEQYPKKVCIEAWGDKTDIVKSLSSGEKITASINVESREFNGRWYTNVRAWRIEKVQEQTPGEIPPPPSEGDFHTSPASSTPSADEDLPF